MSEQKWRFSRDESNPLVIIKLNKDGKWKDSGNITYSLDVKPRIHNLARSAANDAVSKFPSMQLNEKRLELENNIMASLQSELDTAERGVFTVDRVNVTNIITDPTVEQSIQRIADTENQKIIARNQLEIAKTQAEEYKIRSESITESILQDKQLDVLMKLATTENRVFVIPQDFKGIVNIGK